MIALLNCSINLLAINCHHSSTGEVDSTFISYNDLRIINSKLIELKYEKDINQRLKDIIRNDSVLINNYKNTISKLNSTNKCISKQRDIFKQISIGSGIIIIILLII